MHSEYIVNALKEYYKAESTVDIAASADAMAIELEQILKYEFDMYAPEDIEAFKQVLVEIKEVEEIIEEKGDIISVLNHFNARHGSAEYWDFDYGLATYTINAQTKELQGSCDIYRKGGEGHLIRDNIIIKNIHEILENNKWK